MKTRGMAAAGSQPEEKIEQPAAVEAQPVVVAEEIPVDLGVEILPDFEEDDLFNGGE